MDDDTELLRRHVAGDPDAFTELVRRHRDRLWGLALRTLGDREEAADAVQEGLLAAFRSAAGFRFDSAVSTWLHRIVVNACLDAGRRRRARPVHPLGDTDPPAPFDEPGRRDTALAVLAALRRIPLDQAAAVLLVDAEGYPVAEAAAILGVPEGTVKSRCARGRARLAQLLSGSGGNRDGVSAVGTDGPDGGHTGA